MTINKEFLQRKSNITATIICDSVSESGKRITTFELEYMRFLHCELLTHRMLSKNCSSSRAIPIKKMLGYIESNMATPIYFGKNKSGMKAVEEVLNKEQALDVWKESFYQVEDSVNKLLELGLHKQIANRLTEPYQMMKVVCTATEWDNFFNLRIDKDAQPELVMLADKMFNAMQDSVPKTLKAGQWHLPYVDSIEYVETDGGFGEYENNQWYHVEGNSVSLEEAIRISVASCAAVSYRTEGMTLAKADKIFDMLINAETLHSSPFEHVATPINADNLDTMDYTNPYLQSRVKNALSTIKGVTHVSSNGDFCSGNFTNWIQYRHLLDNNTCNNFNYNYRMESF